MARGLLLGVVASAAVLAAAGCAQPVMTRDAYVRALEADNLRLQDALGASRRQVADLKAAGATPQPAPRPPDDPYRPVAVRFGKYTGVVGTGDAQRLRIILEPLDAEGDVVKRAGRVRLEAFETGPDGARGPRFHRWTLAVPELAQTWIGALGIRGYVLKLEWPEGRPPAGESLALVATLTTLSGEALVAEATVAVAPAGAAPAPKTP